MVTKSMKIDNIADIRIPKELSPVIFITGVTGQDGSIITDYLLRETNAYIIGGARRLSVENHLNLKHLEGNPRFQLVNFDLTDSHSIYKLMEVAQPDYFINFAAQSFVASSWDFALQTWEVNSTGVLNCLEAIRKVKPTCRFYNAGSSEEFGNVCYEPQDENHPARPRSPYGASKCASRTLVKVYRESYNLYAVQGWLFNHEGPRRGEDFVTRKITKGVARISNVINNTKSGHEPSFKPIELGNLDATRDWSDAEDMVDGVWRMLNQDIFNENIKKHKEADHKNGISHPQIFDIPHIKEYVCASDENHSIREFIVAAFDAAGIKGSWFINMKNDPLTERYTRVDDGILKPDDVLVTINPKFYRPAEVQILRGNSSLIRQELGWKPKNSFKQLVEKMVRSDLNKAQCQ